MAKITVYDMQKNQVGEREIADSIFDTQVRGYLIHDMVRYQLAARRQGTAASKNRSAVSGGGKKPYKQKGTGNARQGCIRAPHFVGGGAAFGPSPRSYAFKLNRKVKKAALCSALSCRFQENALTVLSELKMDKISTKEFAQLVNRFELQDALFVVDAPNLEVELSARNLRNVKVLRPEGVNVYDVMKYHALVMTEGAVEQLEGALAS
ncbi:50S ribosomal protein L4 [Desulfuromonas thiophila]|jgi:large subunit ribosomal protein L4|uniref:Large ribosomal subunit protein uL4 n=1 Tax=Desulfuromonas thiophila TaxID=57664 RepID=A0A1G6YPS1_9BACT|nr:50S ribosomal protein L4 [Desulfuromonas thiophila]MCK9172091.1 50S ribosomal protein L4 [Desulfuromonas thiophila]MDD3800922.1 50S ribosomal protein L4 [Desulfuromonas thiophila]MDY0397365.1 50S ribosomal protein L4 [Desulfuromonas thiophila]SDD92311.1 LSU ribosomal protein L4P [Desulfuromonas thiophila]